MKRQIKYAIVLVIATGMGVAARGSDEIDQAQFPQITSQPTDQGVVAGATTTFSVQATNGNLSYQWMRDGVAIQGQTNSTLTLQSVGINDVALYSCDVSKEDGEVVPTRAAALNIFTVLSGGGAIVVYGTPVARSGSRGSCPGAYAGYVNYTKTAAEGWGWVPTAGTSVHTASDTVRTDTKVVYTGKLLDYGCAQTSVSVPDPPSSPAYRFTIYFPNNVPSTPYPIVLEGFNP